MLQFSPSFEVFRQSVLILVTFEVFIRLLNSFVAD